MDTSSSTVVFNGVEFTYVLINGKMGWIPTSSISDSRLLSDQRLLFQLGQDLCGGRPCYNATQGSYVKRAPMPKQIAPDFKLGFNPELSQDLKDPEASVCVECAKGQGKASVSGVLEGLYKFPLDEDPKGRKKALFDDNCKKFINPDGSLGEYGKIMEAHFDVPGSPHLDEDCFLGASGKRIDLTGICDNFDSFDKNQKKQFWAWVLASMAQKESSCGAGAAAEGVNGPALGLFQLESEPYRRGRNKNLCPSVRHSPPAEPKMNYLGEEVSLKTQRASVNFYERFREFNKNPEQCAARGSSIVKEWGRDVCKKFKETQNLNFYEADPRFNIPCALSILEQNNCKGGSSGQPISLIDRPKGYWEKMRSAEGGITQLIKKHPLCSNSPKKTR